VRLILRRVQLADGRTRAFINDQAISVQTLKAVGSSLVEIHASMTSRALSMPRPPASARRVRRLEKDVAALETLWDARRAANTVLSTNIARPWTVPPARRTICRHAAMN